MNTSGKRYDTNSSILFIDGELVDDHVDEFELFVEVDSAFATRGVQHETNV